MQLADLLACIKMMTLFLLKILIFLTVLIILYGGFLLSLVQAIALTVSPSTIRLSFSYSDQRKNTLLIASYSTLSESNVSVGSKKANINLPLSSRTTPPIRITHYSPNTRWTLFSSNNTIYIKFIEPGFRFCPTNLHPLPFHTSP